MKDAMFLELKELVSGYSHPIVKGNVAFREGVNLIMAPSGIGKSTLLKTISLILKPISGYILFNGEIIKRRDDFWARECLLLKQGDFFYMDTVFDTISIPFEFKVHKDKSFDKEFMLFLLEEFGFKKNVLKSKFLDLSGGEKQRVALIRVLLLSPSVLLLDEPTVGLDESMSKKVYTYIYSYCTKRVCIVVSHETFAQRFCNAIFEIKKGVLHAKEYRP